MKSLPIVAFATLAIMTAHAETVSFDTDKPGALPAGYGESRAIYARKRCFAQPRNSSVALRVCTG